jgi:hypothetical protein
MIAQADLTGVGEQQHVCNAIKLSHFTAVKMSHPGLVLCALFSKILNV